MRQLDYSNNIGILARYGIRLVPTYIVHLEAQLRHHAGNMQFPVAIKAFSPLIIHKSKEGYAKAGIETMLDLEREFHRMRRKLAERGIENYSIAVQKQANGIEFIVGAKKDAVFGPVVLFGLGGIYTEALNRAAMRICPLSKKLAEEMLDEAAGKINLTEPAKKEILSLLLKVSKLAEKEQIEELDLNPVIVDEKGINIVDSRIMVV